MIAFLCALADELVDLRRLVGPGEVDSGQARRLYRGQFEGREVLLAQTGAGRERAEAATEYVLDRYAVAGLISFGYAGALSPRLGVGHVVICSTLLGATTLTQEGPPTEPCSSDERLVRLAALALMATTLQVRIGGCATMPQVICTIEGKKALHEATGADIVDMESYWIARIALQRQVPFIAVRAVTDTQRDALPPFDQWLNADGKWQARQAALYFLQHPLRLVGLAKLSGSARRARTNLTTAMTRLATAL